MRKLKPELSVDNVSQHYVVHFFKIFGTRSPIVPKRYNNTVKAVLREVLTLWGVQWSDPAEFHRGAEQAQKQCK